MRTQGPQLADHDQVVPEVDDHHPPAELFRFNINSIAMLSGATHDLRVTLTHSGHRIIHVFCRGYSLTSGPMALGHPGAYAIGSSVEERSSCTGMQPSAYAGYVNSYMGGYARVHGDAYLSHNSFRGGVRLQDVFIDGNEAVLRFFNTSDSDGFLTVFGSGLVK